MTVCVILISIVLFHYVPPEYVKESFIYAARDLTTAGRDIVLVYPSLSNWGGPERFNISSEGETYNITYTWPYDKQAYSHSASIPQELFNFYQNNKSHDRRDYAQYAVSEYDREIIRELADSFRAHGQQNKYSDAEIALNVISFVHTIPYTYDIETTGFSEYPRYPIETLVEGGDCEDRAILAAAVIYELDIDCILILMEDHMALGLKDNGNFSGQSYLYNETVYYYAGVADGETGVGVISAHIDPTVLNIFPLVQEPAVSGTMRQYVVGVDKDSYKYQLQGTIRNAGAGHGKNVSLRVVTKITDPTLNISAPDQVVPIESVPEDGSVDVEFIIQVPRVAGVVTVYIEGDNFDPVNVGGFYFTGGS